MNSNLMVNLAKLNPSLNHPHWCKLYISAKRQNLTFLLMFPSKVHVYTWPIFCLYNDLFLNIL